MKVIRRVEIVSVKQFFLSHEVQTEKKNHQEHRTLYVFPAI